MCRSWATDGPGQHRCAPWRQAAPTHAPVGRGGQKHEGGKADRADRARARPQSNRTQPEHADS
eukprot:4977050-Pyramimonas_sp.AAC.1